MHFKPIPFEDAHNGGSGQAGFTKRKIRKAEGNLLQVTEKLLGRLIEEGEGMLVSELTDLTHALHRTALYTQRLKQTLLLKRLKNMTRSKLGQ